MKSFLVVDDSAFMRMKMKNILSEHGYTVLDEAENGKIALEKYKKLSPDAVTLDITMMEMDGLETLKEILKYDAKAKVLMVSAMGQEAIIQEALDAGAIGFLAKPFKMDAVISTILRLSGEL